MSFLPPPIFQRHRVYYHLFVSRKFVRRPVYRFF
uniref:Uncharacterized protein n=1 Tax=Myoviridae sp. ctLEM34 TaxID=2825082 RepID=A0A8S5TR50_9CAUD|nr:MAG TPA: hypothetical protein [Myoviridae sp. ctLEM34]